MRNYEKQKLNGKERNPIYTSELIDASEDKISNVLEIEESSVTLSSKVESKALLTSDSANRIPQGKMPYSNKLSRDNSRQ